MSTKFSTEYAPADRAESQQLNSQASLVAKQIDENHVLDAIADILTILNGQRQIVYANRRLYELLGVTEKDTFGKRPGELLDCVHASESEGGCGTTEFCRECGAVNAILEAQQGDQSVKECRILTKPGGAFDLQVWATPITLSDELFTIFSIKDISHEKRRAALERTFFHDILNTAGNVLNASELMQDADAEDDEKEFFLDMIYHGSEQLVDEIKSQRQLLSAEEGHLEVNLQPVNPLSVLQSIVSVFRLSKVAQVKTINIDPDSNTTSVMTDKTILGRVISNLLKNALEASEPGNEIRLGCMNTEGGIRYFIHNISVMPRSVQLQIFNRSFSTKGSGRGIGTYSIKLFTEQYLKGKVWFESNETSGTTFYLFLPT